MAPQQNRVPAAAWGKAAGREWRVLAALLTAWAAVLGWQNGLGRIDHALYDAALSGLPRAPARDVIIVAIDETSLARIGRWPWPRSTHANLLERLQAARPRAVGFDLILAEADGADGDARFAASIERAGAATPPLPVVLPVLMEPGARGVLHTTLPVTRLSAAAAALGHIHVELDGDGLARSVFLLEGLAEQDPVKSTTWPHFALAVKEAAYPQTGNQALPGERNPNPAASAGVWRRDHWIRIPFAGPPGTYPRVSYADVLDGKVAPEAFTGKLVLVGATAAGLGDAYATPVSGHGRAMPGIEIHANVLDTLLHGRAIVRAAPWANALLSGLIVFLALLGLRRAAPRRGLLLLALLIPATLLATVAALAFARVWFAPAACLAILVLCYPLWSWRRMEAAVRFLGDEFLRIQSEPAILPAPAANTRRGLDLLEQRFSALEAAASQMRNTRRFVADILNSHPDGILVTAPDGTILLANRAASDLFGLIAPDALRGRLIGELMRHWRDRSGHPLAEPWDALRRLAIAGDPESRVTSCVPTAAADPATARSPAAPAALEMTAPDERHLLAHCARGVDAGGATLGWVVSLIDVSPLRLAEARRDEALAFLSHDMRSPQSSILALLELHQLDPDNHPVDAVHTRIENYVRKTLDLSEQFLQVSRAETKEYEFEDTDARELCAAAIDDIWEAAGKKNIALTLLPATPQGRVPMRADRSLLTRAIVNLLSNAVKYSPEGTQVSVLVQALTAPRDGPAATGVLIEVSDQGYGISPEDQQQLFTRYRRFSMPGQPKAAGAGLGMVFVKTVTERHGGRIECQSTPGKGTCFRLALPGTRA